MIYIIYQSIKIALEWYIPQNNKDINNLFQYSIKGEKLEIHIILIQF